MTALDTRLVATIGDYGDTLALRRARQISHAGLLMLTGTCTPNRGRRIAGTDDFAIQAFRAERGFRLLQDRGLGRRDITILPGFIYTIPWRCDRYVAWAAPFAFDTVVIPRPWLRGWLDEHAIAPDRLEAIAHLARDDSLTAQLLSRLAGMIEEEAEFDDLFADHAVGLMLAHLLRLDPPARDTGGLAPWRLRRALRYIEDHVAGDLTLADLAREARMSRFHFCREFKRSIGASPHQFIIARRLARAERMIRESRAPLAEIARACGFGASGRLAAVFRRRHGMTPSAWRARSA